LNSDECFYSYILSIDDYVGLNVQPAVGLDQMSIYVFSYFYDIANTAGLLSDKDESSSISTIPIRITKQTAKNVCRRMTTINEHRFL